MKSFKTETDERPGKSHQTKPIQSRDVRRLASVAAVIETHFAPDAEWNKGEYHKGSLSFRHKKYRNKLIKVFIDYDNELACKVSLNTDPDPVVIGIELGHENPFYVHLVREFLRKNFIYADPENGFDKYYLNPLKGHYYDIVFLREGHCPYEVDEKTVNYYVEEIGQHIPQEDLR